MTGIVFDIKRFAVHDGPGIRTTVFLKGCPLRCYWCHNPESQSSAPVLMQYPRLCIGCRACLEACPHGALSAGETQIVVDRSRCRGCGACAQVCYSRALVLMGRRMTVEQVLEEVRKDLAFYQASGGGLTLSGGEPMLQVDFTAALLQAARAEDLHTALDTSGFAPWEDYRRVLPHTNLVLYDLKYLDPVRHQVATGVDSALILENLRRMSEAGVNLLLRVPTIPGFNADPEQMRGLAEFVARLPRPAPIELLPYHRLGESKHAALGEAPPEALADQPTVPEPELLGSLVDVCRRAGVECFTEQ